VLLGYRPHALTAALEAALCAARLADLTLCRSIQLLALLTRGDEAESASSLRNTGVYLSVHTATESNIHVARRRCGTLVRRRPRLPSDFPPPDRQAVQEGLEQAGTPSDGRSCRQTVYARHKRRSGPGRDGTGPARRRRCDL
jgi:hypothetical protein